MKEAINKFNILGYEYVKLDDLNELVRDMQKKHRAATEPGYMHQNREQSIAADLALNHLRVVLNAEKIHDRMIAKVMRTRFEREDREKAVENARQAIDKAKDVMKRAEKAVKAAKEEANEDTAQDAKPAESGVEKPKKGVYIPPRYTVWHYGADEETTHDSFGFVRFEKGVPLFSNRPCAVMRFVMRDAAENIAERLGEGFEVVDMWSVMTKEERMLRAIFLDERNPGDDEPEYHGDGTKAEDEDWDGEGESE